GNAGGAPTTGFYGGAGGTISLGLVFGYLAGREAAERQSVVQLCGVTWNGSNPARTRTRAQRHGQPILPRGSPCHIADSAGIDRCSRRQRPEDRGSSPTC